jgi:formylglycine-generating enzyme required for sulfatase activity
MHTGFLELLRVMGCAPSGCFHAAQFNAGLRRPSSPPLLALLLAATAMTVRPAAAQCVGDITGNGLVNSADLAVVLAGWGSDGTVEPGSDISGDGIVDGADLGLLMTKWGPCIVVPEWATLIQEEPDPAVVWDPDLRAAISATGLAWRVLDTATQIEMVLIPPGSFQMGCTESPSQYVCSSQEYPVHSVTLTNAFYLGRYEVTQSQWLAVMGWNPSYFQSASAQVPSAQVGNRPVDQVAWNEVANLGGFMGQTGMRLPTEAEWEYAYRAGTATVLHGFAGYPNGTNSQGLVGNIAWALPFNNCSYGSACQTHPVGQKLGNGFGLHDMAGNVWEWVNDWHSADYYAASPTQDPPGPVFGVARVVRGNCWADEPEEFRASDRALFGPGFTDRSVGFRAARTP